MKVGDTFYRLVDGYNDDAQPVLQKLTVAKLTPKGCWIVHSWAWPLRELLTNAKALNSVNARFVSQGARRAYAYPSIELALDSYRARKSWQIRHAERSIRRAHNALEHIDRSRIQDEYITFEKATPAWALNPLF